MLQHGLQCSAELSFPSLKNSGAMRQLSIQLLIQAAEPRAGPDLQTVAISRPALGQAAAIARLRSHSAFQPVLQVLAVSCRQVRHCMGLAPPAAVGHPAAHKHRRGGVQLQDCISDAGRALKMMRA